MRDLNEMTLGQRIVLTFVIVLIILFAIAVAGWISGGWDETPAAPVGTLYGDTPLDATLLPIDREALTAAYHQQVIKLFTIWITDSVHDPTRFRNGLRIARDGFHQAAGELDKRQQQLENKR